jgi:hypothetical protein
LQELSRIENLVLYLLYCVLSIALRGETVIKYVLGAVFRI